MSDTITLLRCELKRAREAFEYFRDTAECAADTDIANEAISNICACLDQPEQRLAQADEPVAWAEKKK